MPVLDEVLPRVVDDPARPDRSDHVHVLRAAHPGHVRSEGLGDLDREGTHASRRAVDEDLLPGADMSLVSKALQGGLGRDGHRCGLFERDAGRLRHEVPLLAGHVLGEGPAAHAEDPIAGLKLLHVRADLFHLPCHIDARDRALGSAEAR